jgi:hypothetical protein
MLNFACSLLRPVDALMAKTLADAMASEKVQLNMKLGAEMMNELPFYEIDVEELGTESEGDPKIKRGQLLTEDQKI